jgi:hypothetical protein
LNAPGNSAPHAATEMNFGLPSAASGRLARHGRPGPGATYLRTAINTCGIALPCGDRNEFRSTCRRGAGADAGCGRVRRNSFRHGLGRTWGERKGAPKFISAWVGGGQGATEINFGQHAGAGRGRTRGERKGAPKFISAWVGGGQGATEINFGQHAGAGQGRTRGERKGAPKFISAWVGGGQGATEINFGQRAGAGQGRTRGAAGCAEIHFGMGWGRTRGDREGAPKFISAWVVSRSGVTEINFGHRAGAGRGRTRGAAGCAEIHFGMGCEQKRGDRNKFRSTGRRGAGRTRGAAGCAEIHFGMGCEQKRGDRNKFRSTGRRGAGADAGCGRVRRNSFRHGL